MERFFRVVVFGLLAMAGIKGWAQTLPANRVEQDACGAIQICGNSFSTPYSYVGNGLVDDLYGTPCDAGGASQTGEDNAVWLRLNIITSGTIVFTLTPNVNTDDYDWAIVNLTGKSCDNFSSSDVVRCNFNNNYPVYNGGVTGLNMTSNLTGAASGVTGNSFLRRIDAVAGQVYLVMVNNFGSGNGNGNTLGSGFTIDFSGSTATFNNSAPPKMQSLSNICFQGTQITLGLNKEVMCTSIATNGSDFQLSPAVANIISLSGTNCNSMNQGYSDQITVTFNQQLAPGTYYLKAKVGTDNNTLLDLCNGALALPDSLKFVVYPDNRDSQTVTVEGCGQVVFNGKTYTESTVIRDTVFNSGGCDSVYFNASIVVYGAPAVVTDYVSSCDTVVFRGVVYREDATVVDTFKNHFGCDSLLHEYKIHPEHLELNVTVDPPEPVIGDYVVITTSNIQQDNYSIQAWMPQEWFPSQTSKTQQFFIPHSDTIKIVGTSANGCVDTLKFFLKADTLVPIVRLPNAFSPNGDGNNDVFEPQFVNKSGYQVKDFKVFDRWGKIIYSASGTKKAAWDGTYSGSGKTADVGTYYYYLDVLFIDGTKGFLKGDVTLIR